MASRLNQFDNVSPVEITRMLLTKCMAEQISKNMRKALLDNALYGVEDVLEARMYALAPDESKHQVQEGTAQ